MPTFQLAISFAFALLAGCQTAGPCDYSLSQHGWVPELAPPSEVVADSSGWKGARFFSNVAGEILVCPNRWPRDNCGSVYRIYDSTGDGFTSKDIIVCMT